MNEPRAGTECGGLYDDVYRRSLEDAEGFWAEAGERLHWYRKWDQVLDDSDPPFCRWFGGGETNLCYNAVDRHVLNAGADRAALIWESAAQGKTETITYGDLLRRVSRFAAVLRHLGVGKGDRVATFLPMVPEAVVAMLACVRIGAIHAVIFTGYGVDTVAARIQDAAPKVLITADAALRRNKAIPLKGTVDRSLETAPVESVIVLDRGLMTIAMKPGRDRLWSDLARDCGDQSVDPLPVAASDPSGILYTSGATGLKGVVRDTGGYMVALHNSMKQVFDVRDGDVFWATSDLGWVVGHSYSVYAPLLYGVTSLIFEGTPDHPDHGVMWRVIEKHRVSVWFSAPTAMRMLRRFGIDHARRSDISSLRYLFLAGEILDAPTWHWSREAVRGRPVIDNYWLTESGWPVVANQPGIELLPMKPGSPTRPVVGYALDIVDRNGTSVPRGATGHLVMRFPLPPGNITTLWRDDERYVREYWRQFPGGVFATGDYAVADDDGYLTLLGRSDDVLNVAAHRLGIGDIEKVLRLHPAVAEVCVIGIADAIKGEEPVALVVLNEGHDGSSQLRVDIKSLVRDRAGAIAVPRAIHFVPALPRTGGGRYMRKVLRAICEKRDPSSEVVAEEGVSPDEVAAAIAEMTRALG